MVALPGALETYVAGHRLPCPRCKKPLHWWKAIVEGIERHFQFGQVMAMAGCRTLHFELDVPPGQTVEVNLADRGVPENAEIVHMNLTGRGGVWPLMVHGNDAIREPLGVKFWLYGRPLKAPAEGSGHDVGIMATWFVRRPDDTVVRHLVDAARHYQADRFDAVVVPANVAAEASLTPVLTHFFERYAGKDEVREMLGRGATYSHQLNVLMNVAADVLGVSRLDGHIRGLLNRLRKLRNNIAHEGRCKGQSRTEAAEHLAAAFFLVSYVKVLGDHLSAASKT